MIAQAGNPVTFCSSCHDKRSHITSLIIKSHPAYQASLHRGFFAIDFTGRNANVVNCGNSATAPTITPIGPMTARFSPRLSTRTQTPPPAASRLFQKSLSGWYAEWRAQRENPPSPEPTPSPSPESTKTPNDEVRELARWLTESAGG